MDRSTKLFAIGPFAPRERLSALGAAPEPAAYVATSARHFLVETRTGWFFCTADHDALGNATRTLGEPKWRVTIEVWNAFSEGATVARVKRERQTGGAVETSWVDRRHGELAYGGVLDEVATDWLAQHLRSLDEPCAGAPSSKEMAQRARAERFLSRLVDEGHLVLAPGATVADIGARACTILFAIKRDMAPLLERMFRSSTKVLAFRGTGEDLHRCLKEEGIRPR